MSSNEPHQLLSKDNQVASLLASSTEVIPMDSSNENFIISDLSDDDSNQLATLADADLGDITDEIGDFDDTQSEPVQEKLAVLLNYLTLLSKSAATSDNPQSNKSFVVKSSGTDNTVHFIDGTISLTTNQSLRLTVPPSRYQHVRYSRELDETLRYMTMLTDDPITLEMPDFQNLYGTDVSLWLRILRITKPYGSDEIVFVHPYPIWMNHEYAKIYKNGLFIPVSRQIIKIDTLVMQRLQQNELRNVNDFAIHSSQKLNLNESYPIKISRAKDKISEYQLRYSALHFQIFTVDANNVAYPTDLECQTELIYEYEAKEWSSLSLISGSTQVHSNKRKQVGQRNQSQSAKEKKLQETS